MGMGGVVVQKHNTLWSQSTVSDLAFQKVLACTQLEALGFEFPEGHLVDDIRIQKRGELALRVFLLMMQ